MESFDRSDGPTRALERSYEAFRLSLTCLPRLRRQRRLHEDGVVVGRFGRLQPIGFMSGHNEVDPAWWGPPQSPRTTCISDSCRLRPNTPQAWQAG